MNNVYLREISTADAKNYDLFLMFKDIGPNENGFINTCYDYEFSNFEEYIKVTMEGKKNPKPNRVPQTTFILMDSNKYIGYVKIRHYLIEALMKRGGHIGYGIRKSERGKRYGNKILELALREARKIGISRALLTCDESNILSRKIIERNNGKLEEIADKECIYWIEIEEKIAQQRFQPDNLACHAICS